MALSYTDSVGVSYDADQGFFDGPEIITIDLVGEAIDSAEAFGSIRLNHRLAFTGISSSEAFGTLSANHGLVAFEGIPGASGNKLLRSAEFDNSAWGKSGVTVVANSILSPDGEMTADEIIENTSNSNHGVSQGQFRLNVGAPHICSVRAKLGVGSRLLKFNGFGNGGNGVTFNLLTGATQSNASWGALSATDLGDDWWLCSGILNPNDNVNGLVISLSETAGGVNYIGDGVSSIYLEGAMFVEGSIETPYIATFGLPADAIGSELQLNHQILGQGVVSLEAFGTLKTTSQVDIVGIPTAEAHGIGRYSYPYDETPAPWSFDNDPGTFDGTEFWQAINPINWVSDEAFGLPLFADAISPEGIATEEAFGTFNAQLVLNGLTGIPTAEAVSAPQVNHQLLGIGLASAEAFGTSRINRQLDIVGIPSEEAHGVGRYSYTYDSTPIPCSFDEDRGTFDGTEFWQVIKFDGGIPSAEAFGTLTIQAVLAPVAIPSQEVFGAPQINHQVLPVALPSLEAFGAIQLDQKLFFNGILTAEAFGTPLIAFDLMIPEGIVSAEAFGVPLVQHSLQLVSIASEEAFGAVDFFKQWKAADAIVTPWIPEVGQTDLWIPALPVNLAWIAEDSHLDAWVAAGALSTSWAAAAPLNSAWNAGNVLTNVWTPASNVVNLWTPETPIVTAWDKESPVNTEWLEAA